MTQADQINQQLAENRELYDYFQNHKTFWEADLATKKALIDAYIVSARSEYPVEEITKNMQMRVNSSTGAIEGLSKHASNCVVEHVVNTNVLPANRPTDERELLALMAGHDDTRYIVKPFNIVRASWDLVLPESGKATFTGVHFSMAGEITIAAFVKPISGDVRGKTFTGLDINNPNWQLCGQNISRSFGAGYTGNHPKVYSSSGEVLIALAGIVKGRVDLSDPRNWGLFGVIETAASGEY